MYQIAIAVFIAIYLVAYLVGIKRGEVKPIFATWIFFSFATVLSFITDFAQTGVEGLAANAYNITDTIATVIVTIVVICSKDVRKKFTTFESVCLGAVGLVFIGWLVSGQNIVAHLLIQGILVIAYLPTIVHLWNAKKNTESLLMWSCSFVASSIGIIEPIKTAAFLPTVYSIRAIVSTLVLIVLILRLKARARLA